MSGKMFIQPGVTVEPLRTMFAYIGFNFLMRVTVVFKTAFMLEFSTALVTRIVHSVAMHQHVGFKVKFLIKHFSTC